MPTYVYETIPADGARPERFELSQRMSEAALTRHPDTGVPVRRVITGGLGLVNVGVDKASACAPEGCGLPACQRPVHTCTPGCDH